jgi:hypothetical protein
MFEGEKILNKPSDEYEVSETYFMTTNVLAGLGDFHRSVSGNSGGGDIQDTWRSEIQQTLINPLSSRHT